MEQVRVSRSLEQRVSTKFDAAARFLKAHVSARAALSTTLSTG